MRRLRRLPRQWSNAPAAILAIVALLVLAGIGIIIQNEAAYRDLQEQETRVQAEILAASVTAALDFGDRQAAQEAVDATRVNRQVRMVGIYDAQGRLVAGYGRDGDNPPGSASQPPPAGRVVSSRVPVLSSGERIGSVMLTTDPEPLSRRLTRYLVIVLLVAMAAIVIAVLGTAQNALRRANRQLGERARALVRTNAELKVQISERARAEDQLRQAQKLQALGQLTGGIAHDFNNLLTVIQGSADMLRRPELDETKRIRFAEAVVQASARAAALTGQLLAFARRQPLRPEVLDVNDLIRTMIDLLDRTLGERILIRTDLTSRGCAVEADRAQLESAILNIAVNARDAMPDGGTLVLRTAPHEDGAEGRMVAISVADSGFGMDEETLGRAIEPFFTTKSTGKGTGLGLSQVYGFATQSGGDVRIESVPGEGTTVTLILPCSSAPMLAESEDHAGSFAPQRTGRILVVEDNEDVGDFASTMLEEVGYEVVRVRSGEQAIERIGRDRFDLVFSDVVMPGMSGLELEEEVKRLRPDLPVVLTTGYSDQIAASGTGGRPVVLKPYRIETLTSMFDQMLKGSGPGR